MIKIDRSTVPSPWPLDSGDATERFKAAAAFFEVKEINRKQKRFNFGLQFAQPELQSHLHDLFKDKCAYCESYIFSEKRGTPFLDRFRPTSGAIGIDGHVTVDAYWWLAYEWDNMYACCVHCNRAKGSRFPIEGKRARPGTRGQALDAEKSFLVDPCRDDPDEHLLFHPNGHVIGVSEKGRITIQVFNLNRDELVQRRMKEAHDFELLELYGLAENEEVSPSSLDSSKEFAALRRQMTRDHAQKVDSALVKKAAEREQEIENKEFRDLSLADPIRARRALARTRYIESIRLINVGIHERTEIQVASTESAGAPWTVLLGENGVGKSTVLKAIAFVLAGESRWNALGEFAEALLPRRTSAKGRVGEIALKLSDGQELSMKINANAERIETNASAPKLYLLGFGSTRLPPNKVHQPPAEEPYSRLLNLFDPFAPLGDAIAWLVSLPPLQFERAGRTLRALLDLPDETHFSRKGKSVFLVNENFQQDVATLSDGYQTIIGIGCDIMSVLLAPGLPMEYAEGIVLIDEIGNHLHPTWRMRLVDALKTAFPRVQFIATTHEPLCLRGLENDEVAVLMKDSKHRVHLVDSLPPIRGLLVDQLLSSPHFGLRSTIDPKFAKVLDEYYELISKTDPTENELERIKLLEPEVCNLRLVGDSPREQVLLRTIDSYLASAEASLEAIDPAQLPEDLESELFSLLQASEPDVSND
nr:AAA family ATPase [uncultured Cupriavidus sp.]